MTIVNFTPLSAFIGGLMVGIGSLMLMATIGRIAGFSGIARSAVFDHEGRGWRLAFLMGTVLPMLVFVLIQSPYAQYAINKPYWLIAIAAFITGVGTTWGGGCTSGHGICGLSRFSMRSIVATGIFMLFGFITVIITRHIV